MASFSCSVSKILTSFSLGSGWGKNCGLGHASSVKLSDNRLRQSRRFVLRVLG